MTTTKPEPVWRAPHVGARIVTIRYPGSIDVMPDELGPEYTVPDSKEVTMLAVSSSAPLAAGQRIAIRFKSDTPLPTSRSQGRPYDCIFWFDKETPKRIYIRLGNGQRLSPIHKSTIDAVHAVVGVFRPEEARA